MVKSGTATQFRNLDHRVSVEQTLPTLATKVDLERFATKKDFERFATKEDLERFVTKEDLREESERSRRYMHMLYESLLDKINQILEMLQGHTPKLEEHGSRLDGHDSRIGAIFRLSSSQPASALRLTSYVGQRIAATGTLVNQEMRTRSLHPVSASCSWRSARTAAAAEN